jgi:hypothetical protein
MKMTLASMKNRTIILSCCSTPGHMSKEILSQHTRETPEYPHLLQHCSGFSLAAQQLMNG